MVDFENNSEPVTYTLEDARQSLLKNDERFTAAVSHGLSDVPTAMTNDLNSLWRSLNVLTRQQLIAHLVEAAEVNFELNFKAVGLIGLQDEDETVREKSVELLWEDESTETLEILAKMAVLDASEQVRAAAVGALGRFVLLGEYGKLPERYTQLAQDTAVQVWTNESEQNSVRRRALEAIANSSHEIVPEAVIAAYRSADEQMIASAIYAMGNTCDERWAPSVLRELGSETPAHRYEATRAAGELELKAAIQPLGRIALNDERDIQELAIWALGEIGGDLASKVL
ncbi:MAG: phycocyanin alpha phycocyanobilin lyase, partial [Chloroflexota bacterium]